MKKIMALMVVTALIVSAGMAPAAEQKKPAEPPPNVQTSQPPPMPGPGMPGMQRPMGQMPPGMMMGPMPIMRTTVRQMVASDDGGVIVSTGDKLIKYDKNLNIVKEVTIPQEPPMMGGMQPPEQPKEQKK